MKSAMKFGFLALIASAGIFAGAGVAHADPHGWHNGGPKYNQRDDNRYQGRPVVVNRWDNDRGNNRWNNNNWNNNGWNHDNGNHNGWNNNTRYVIHDRDRVVITNYVQRSWRPLPTRYAPRYLIGAPLAYGIPYYAVPQNVLVQMQPVPYGYRYVRVDDDVLLLDAAANVIDAVAHLTR